MGKNYCTKCGSQLKDSDKFCSNCGNIINDNTSNSGDLTIMERIEIVPLGMGILFCVLSLVIAFLVPYHYQTMVLFLGLVIGSFLMGYLSNESILIVLGYAILISIITFLISWLSFSGGFFHMSDFFMPLFLTIIFSFFGNFVKVKLKS